MPIYEYQCEQNKHKFELLQPISAGKVTQCPLCDSEAQRIMSRTSDYGSSGSCSTGFPSFGGGGG
jgi:putative FmdB family regulatory protein